MSGVVTTNHCRIQTCSLILQELHLITRLIHATLIFSAWNSIRLSCCAMLEFTNCTSLLLSALTACSDQLLHCVPMIDRWCQISRRQASSYSIRATKSKLCLCALLKYTVRLLWVLGFKDVLKSLINGKKIRHKSKVFSKLVKWYDRVSVDIWI